MMSSNRFLSLSCATLAFLALPLGSSIRPADAAETTIAVCETSAYAARVYNQNGQVKMRVFDRIRKVTFMDGPATSMVNPEIVEYQNLRGEQPVTTRFNRNSLIDCSIMVSGQMAPGRVTQGGGDSISNVTIGVCEALRDTARIYDQSGQLKMRVFDRVKNVMWMDAPARRMTNPEVVEYRNTRGEVIVRTNFNRNSPTDCSIIVGSKVEAGRARGDAANP